jgi:hypothetical protein
MTCRSTGSNGVAERQPGAEAAAREVEHVVDEGRHAGDAFSHHRDDGARLFVERRPLQKLGAGADGGQRIAQVVAENGDELFAQLRRGARVEQVGFRRRQPLTGVEVKGDQLGEQLEHADDARVFQFGRFGVDRAQRAEEAAVLEEDRHRDVALEAVHRRGRMPAIDFILGHVIDDHRFAGLADLMTDGGLDLELAAGFEAEIDFVIDREADPAVRGDARYGGKAHPGDAAHDIQDRRHRLDGLDHGDVCLKIVTHQSGIHKPIALST